MEYLSNSAFDGLVAGFYRAATGEITWGDALRPVESAFGARMVVLHTLDLSQGGRLTDLAYGSDQGWAREAVLHYIAEWHLQDP